jgi:hypothetical protein
MLKGKFPAVQVEKKLFFFEVQGAVLVYFFVEVCRHSFDVNAYILSFVENRRFKE